MKTCDRDMSDFKPCGRDLFDGEYCIFHSKKGKKYAGGFDKKFMDEFKRQKEEEKWYDFRGFVFPHYFRFEHFDFDKDVSFEGATFLGTVHFLSADFSGKANFDGAKFLGKTSFKYATFSGDSLEGLFEALRIKGIKRICKGRYKIQDFRFRLSEKIAKEYPVIDRMTKDAWYLDDYKSNYPIIYWFWNITANCGRSLLLWSSWAIVLALSFAEKFYCMGPGAFEITNLKFSFETMIYYSVVTFTTLGFGDITPKTVEASQWVMFEVVVGYVMLGGLISIFANKLARRS